MMHRYTLSIGSNEGDRRKNVEEAIEWLSQLFIGVTVSGIYETPSVPVNNPQPQPPQPPEGGVTQPGNSPYLNAVIRGYSPMRVPEMENVLKAYELSHGRDEESRRLHRVPIDIDIVCCDACILRRWDYKQSFFLTGYHQINPL